MVAKRERRFVPIVVHMYVGGVDPYKEDRLGSLRLTKEGIKRRDMMVFRSCRDHGVPVAAVLAGGYASDLEDTVEMHANTYLTLREALDGGQGDHMSRDGTFRV